MADLGMYAFLAVSKGSERPGLVLVTLGIPATILNNAPVVLCRSGATSDTGGISLKPGLA